MADIQKLTKICEDAAKKFAADRSKENMVALMNALENGLVFVPVMTDQKITPEMLEASKEDGKLVLPQGTTIKNHLLQTTEGDLIFPVFTNANEITAENMKDQVLLMPFYECAKVVMKSEGKIKGAVVNPFTDNIGIIEGLLKTCVERTEALKKAKESGQLKKVKVTEKEFHTIVRNQIEMRNLPTMVYKERQSFVQKLMDQRGDLLFNMYRSAYGSQVPFPYEKKEFAVMSLNVRENFELISIDLPSGKSSDTFCYKIYITWDKDKDEFHYFVMQKQKKETSFAELEENGNIARIGEAPAEGTELGAVMDYLGMND